MKKSPKLEGDFWGEGGCGHNTQNPDRKADHVITCYERIDQCLRTVVGVGECMQVIIGTSTEREECIIVSPSHPPQK